LPVPHPFLPAKTKTVLARHLCGGLIYVNPSLCGILNLKSAILNLKSKIGIKQAPRLEIPTRFSAVACWVMLKAAEKHDSLTIRMVEVCKKSRLSSIFKTNSLDFDR
jgi:hypothetical protein